MFINNKKLWIGLSLTTIALGVTLRPSFPKPIDRSELLSLASELNSNLPVQVDANTSLRKVSVITTDGINFLDFYYLLNTSLENTNVLYFKKISPKLIQQACNSSPTKDVLQHSTVVRYQYITIDKKSLPTLAILPRDCNFKN